MKKGTSMVFTIILAIVLAVVFVYVGIKMLPVVKESIGIITNTTNESQSKLGSESFLKGTYVGKCPTKNGFVEICANFRHSDPSKPSLLKKVGDCPYDSCYKDPYYLDYVADDIGGGSNWYMSPDCKKFLMSQIPVCKWCSYKDETLTLFQNCFYNGQHCERDGKDVGQCLRLDFKNYYKKPVNIGSLCFKYGGGYKGSKIIVDLLVFKCSGSCEDGGSWKFVKEIKDKSGFATIDVDDTVDMIDICPKYGTAPQNIAWVKFTTNSNLVERKYSPCDSNDEYDVFCSENVPEGGTKCIEPQNGEYGYVVECEYDDVKDCVSGSFKYYCPGVCNYDESDCGHLEEIDCSSKDECNKIISYVRSYPQKIVLQNDITVDGDGLIIEGKGNDEEGIEIDCNNHKIENTGTMDNTIGIKIKNSLSVAIYNCHIVGFDTGIHVYNSTSLISNNVIEGYKTGIFVENSQNGVYIESNLLDGEDKATYGISIIYSKVDLRGNEVCKNENDMYCGDATVTNYYNNIFSSNNGCDLISEKSCSPQTTSFCANQYVEKEKCDCMGSSGCEGDTTIDIDNDCNNANCGTSTMYGTDCFGNPGWNETSTLCLYNKKECCNYYYFPGDVNKSLGQCLRINVYRIYNKPVLIDELKIRGSAETGNTESAKIFACYQSDYKYGGCVMRCGGNTNYKSGECDGYSRYVGDIEFGQGTVRTVDSSEFTGGLYESKLVRYIDICPIHTSSKSDTKIDWVKLKVTK